MTVFTEGPHPGEAIIYEDPRSREQITIMASQTLVANQVLGKTAFAATVGAAAAASTNTGNGTVTLANPAFGGDVMPGVYRLFCIEPGTNGGVFRLESPDGRHQGGRIVVGTAFTGPINFTIADGATDFVAGDSFTFTVTGVQYRWGAFDPAATDGRQVPAGMLFDAVTTGAGVTARAVAVVRAAALNAKSLQWISGLNDAGKTLAIETLNAQPGGIVVRA